MRPSKILLSLFIFILISSCSNSDKKTSSNKASEPIKELVEIDLLAIGESMAEIAFEPKNITVKENTRIRLTLENKSSAAGMLHNFVLVEIGSGAEIAKSGIKAGKKNHFVPKDSRVIAFTEIIDLGETVSIEFDAPSKGSYHYICTFPGHYPNMVGRMIIE